MWPGEDEVEACPARAGRARAGSGRAGSRSRPRCASAFGSSRGAAAHDQPRIGSRRSTRSGRAARACRPSSRSSVAGSSSRRSERRACGSRLMRDVVVAEHGERRPRQDAHEPPQHRLAARMRQQVAGDRDEVRLPLARPHGRLPRPRRSPATGRRSGSPRGATIRSPSSSGGRPGSSSSSSRSRTQPASSRPQPTAGAGERAERALRLRAARAPAAGRRCGA